MTWRLRVGQGATLGVFATSLLLASACSGDSNVDFDPITSLTAGTTSQAGTTSTDAGSSAVAGTSAGGSSTQGGSAQAGSSTQAGNAGTTSGGSDTGGTDAGGASAAGSGGAGGNGGTAGAGGSAAGSAGTGGDGGSSGTAGGGVAGTGGGGAAGSAGSSGAGAGGGGAGGGGAGGGGTGGGGSGGGGSGGTDAGGVGGGGSSSGGAGAGGGGTSGGGNGGNGGSGGGTSVPPGCTAATFNNHVYLFCGSVDNELAAAQLCADAGMNLIIVGSAEENAFVAGKIKGSTWLGGSDDQSEGDWFWWDATQFTANKKPINGVYSNWGNGQPNDNGAQGAHENCMAILPATNLQLPAQWNDLACDLTGSRAACEAPLP